MGQLQTDNERETEGNSGTSWDHPIQVAAPDFPNISQMRAQALFHILPTSNTLKYPCALNKYTVYLTEDLLG